MDLFNEFLVHFFELLMVVLFIIFLIFKVFRTNTDKDQEFMAISEETERQFLGKSWKYITI